MTKISIVFMSLIQGCWNLFQGNTTTIDVSPINPKYIPDGALISENNSTLYRRSVVLANFSLEALGICLITIDLRHLNETQIIYNNDWMLDFTYQDNGAGDGTGKSMNMPKDWISYNMKSDIHQFSILSYINMTFEISITLLNSKYQSHQNIFINTTSVEIIYPERQHTGSNDDQVTHTQFAVILQNSGSVNLPLNLPGNKASTNPDYIIGFLHNKPESLKNHRILEEDQDKFNPNSKYWGDANFLVLNYLPFLSNCKGFDKYIPLTSLIEQHEACRLVPEANTEYVSPYSFGGKIPEADICENVQVECTYDELTNETTQYEKWFNLEVDTELFQITKSPVSIDRMRSQIPFLDEEIISVQVGNHPEQDKIPREVTLDLYYFQMTKREKKLMSGSIGFGKYQELTAKELAGEELIKFNFTFNYIPMTNTQLIVSFAFGWELYLLLYMGIGLFALLIVLIFHIYHMILFRKEKHSIRSKPRSMVLPYIKLAMKPCIKGVIMAFFPVFSFVVLASILMKGYIVNKQILSPQEFCDFSDSPNLSMSDCIIAMFDSFYSSSKSQKLSIRDTRYGRIGLTFLVAGIYLLLVGGNLLIAQDKKEHTSKKKNNQKEAFDGNIFETRTWKITHFTFVSILMIIIELYIIYFSFTSFLANNLWTMIVVLQIFMMITEYILEGLLVEKLLVNPLSSNMCKLYKYHYAALNYMIYTLNFLVAMIWNLATYGANNFLEFLKSYLIGIAIQVVQRTYINVLVEDLTKYLERKFEHLSKKFNRYLEQKDEEENDLLNNPKQHEDWGATNKKHSHLNLKKIELEGERLEKGDENLEDLNKFMENDSDIILTEEKEDSISIDNSEISLETPRNIEYDANSSADSIGEFLQDDFEGKVKKRNVENSTIDTELKKKNTDNQNFDDKTAKDHEDFMINFIGISNDMIGAIFFPICLGIIWFFYDETNMMSNYNITKEGFIFYFLFALVVIPVQSLLDALFYNIIENFLKVDMFYFLSKFKDRFEGRKTLWMAADQDENHISIETEFKSLDKMCFSSQYYFSVVIHLAGQVFMVIGIQIVISADYNIFADNFAVFVVIFWLIVCIAIHRTTKFIGKFFKIWSVDQSLNNEETILSLNSSYSSSNLDMAEKKYSRKIQSNGSVEIKELNKMRLSNLNKLFSRVNKVFDETAVINVNKEAESKWNSDEMNNNNLKIPNFDKVLAIKLREERLKDITSEFTTEKFNSDEFRRHFIKRNRKWIRDNLRLVFTPSTIKFRKKEILDSFGSIYGDLNSKGEKAGEEANQSITSEIDVNEINIINHGNDNFNITPCFVSLLKYWVNRSRNLKLIRSYIGGLLEELTKNYCDFCGRNWGLRAELLENLEELYKAFLSNEKAFYSLDTRIVKWQNYFRANATIRTLCYLCSNVIWDRYRQNLEIFQKAQKKLIDGNPLDERSYGNLDLLKRKSTFRPTSKSLTHGLKRQNGISNEEDSQLPHHRFLLFWLELVRKTKLN